MTMSRIAAAVAVLAAACAVQAQTAAKAPAGLAAAGTAAIADQGAKKVYIVQLAAAPVATYAGTVRGLAATKPAAGARLNSKAPRVRAYLGHLDNQRNTVLSRLGKVAVLHTYNTTFNGFSALLTEAQAARLMSYADVKSVTESEVRQLDTTRTPDFLGLTAPGGLHSQLDAQSRNVKGEDIIIGVIDGGIWPENPSFGDKLKPNGEPAVYHEAGALVYDPPPAKWAGVCQTGEGFTAAMCGHKLIGARYYSADFLASGARPGAQEYLSPRDGDGHGSHTASTSGGNANVRNRDASGVVVGVMSGIAPRARVAAYKVCWNATVSLQTGCYGADILAAIDDAVADGVDVINYSVSGTQLDFLDPIEIAYLNATAAGVFVAASAGNSGPGNTVAHISPWLTTVGNSTHDRQAGGGDLTLGNGAVYSGFSLNFEPLPATAMVLSNTIPAAGQAANANTCLANSLDITQAAGKIVVCDRGTNNAAARLAASAEVKRAGGVGMVLLNPTSTTLAADAHTVPTVHLQNTDRDAVRNYVTNEAGPTGLIGLSYHRPGVNAPVMANSSSRGPNKANGNILKPDITGPGSSIVASVSAVLSAANKAALIAGTYTPPAAFATYSGTSMSSPHVAGSAALLRQLFPTWSPAAIKSALMTSTTGVKLANGNPDPNRWGYGAGHLNPNGAALPSLVYDADASDYGRFLCGLSLTPPAGLGGCATLGNVKPWNLNLPSLTAAGVVVSRTLTRKVTNVSDATRTYVAAPSLPGWDVVVTPASLTLAPGASASFDAKLTRTTATLGAWTFGSLAWSDGVVSISSPLSAQALAFAAPAEISDQRASGRGSKVFAVESSYTGVMSLSSIGLVPAIVNENTVSAPAAQCYSFVVPAGASFARWQLFNADTQGGASTDLDLEVFSTANCTGPVRGSSFTGTSDEVVTLESFTGTAYSARVTGYATPVGGATYKLSTWIVGPADGVQTLRAVGPSSVYAGGTASVGLSWNVPAGKRYMGLVHYFDGTPAQIGATKVLVDNR